MLVVPADGTLALAQFLKEGRVLQPYACLFVNDFIPDHNTALVDLQECAVPGYARLLMGPPSVVLPQADGSAIMRWSGLIWGGFSPPPVQTAFGYFVVQLDSHAVLRLLWVERMSPKILISGPTVAIAFSSQLVVQTLFG
jgi:hypothetical protein